MALRTEQDLSAAWNALSSPDEKEGWRYILIGRHGSARILAGRRFPDNSEGLLVGFDGARMPGARQLLQGHGFEVSEVLLPDGLESRAVIGLIRAEAGSLEMFGMMAQDLVAVLERTAIMTVQEQLQAFLRRVTAWQEFMMKPGNQLLSAEAEVGLFGELAMIELLLDAGMEPAVVIEAWKGPQDGVQDFLLGNGSIEVKSSAAISGFIAKIGSLDQLDDAISTPLFLACQRFAADDGGATLFENIDRIRERLEATGARQPFDVLLLHAGALEQHRDSYTRRLSLVETRMFPVDGQFPRLTGSIVGPVIRRAVYEMDVDLLQAEAIAVPQVIERLGIDG